VRICVGRAIKESVEVDESVMTKNGNLPAGRGHCALSDETEVAGVERVSSSESLSGYEAVVSVRPILNDSMLRGRDGSDFFRILDGAELVDDTVLCRFGESGVGLDALKVSGSMCWDEERCPTCGRWNGMARALCLYYKCRV
jgi:hypothetical protein